MTHRAGKVGREQTLSSCHRFQCPVVYAAGEEDKEGLIASNCWNPLGQNTEMEYKVWVLLVSGSLHAFLSTSFKLWEAVLEP